MDDSGNDKESGDVVYSITPKGYLCNAARQLGVNDDDCDLLWNALQAGCMQILRREYPNADFAGLVFDGHGGEVLPLEQHQSCDQ